MINDKLQIIMSRHKLALCVGGTVGCFSVMWIALNRRFPISIDMDNIPQASRSEAVSSSLILSSNSKKKHMFEDDFYTEKEKKWLKEYNNKEYKTDRDERAKDRLEEKAYKRRG